MGFAVVLFPDDRSPSFRLQRGIRIAKSQTLHQIAPHKSCERSHPLVLSRVAALMQQQGRLGSEIAAHKNSVPESHSRCLAAVKTEPCRQPVHPFPPWQGHALYSEHTDTLGLLNAGPPGSLRFLRRQTSSASQNPPFLTPRPNDHPRETH
jgi:hypothetical protein